MLHALLLQHCNALCIVRELFIHRRRSRTCCAAHHRENYIRKTAGAAATQHVRMLMHVKPSACGRLSCVSVCVCVRACADTSSSSSSGSMNGTYTHIHRLYAPAAVAPGGSLVDVDVRCSVRAHTHYTLYDNCWRRRSLVIQVNTRCRCRFERECQQLACWLHTNIPVVCHTSRVVRAHTHAHIGTHIVCDAYVTLCVLCAFAHSDVQWCKYS